MTVSRWSNRACRRVPRSPTGARTAAAAVSAAGSRSIPTSERSGRASSSSRAWPPPPTVASTNTPGGTGRKISTIRSAITGRWWNSVIGRILHSAGHRTPSGPFVRSSAAPRPAVAAGMSPRLARRKRAELGLSILPTGRLQMSEVSGAWFVRSSASFLLVLALCALEGGPATGHHVVVGLDVPDLDPVEGAGDHHAGAELQPGEVPQRPVDADAALGVHGGFEGAGGEGPLLVAADLAPPHLVHGFGRHLFERLRGKHVDAAVTAHGEVAAGFEPRAER